MILAAWKQNWPSGDVNIFSYMYGLAVVLHRPGCYPWLPVWSDGELGADHLPRDGPPLRPRQVLSFRQTGHYHGHRPWARTPGSWARLTLNVSVCVVVTGHIQSAIYEIEKVLFSIVVREPGDNGVVERPVAQWGFCQVHGVYFSWHHLPRAACGETCVKFQTSLKHVIE